MTVAQGDVLRATAEMTLHDDALQNVLHFRSTNPATITDAQALLDMGEVLDLLFLTVDQLMAEDVTFDLVRVQNVTQGVLLGATVWPSLVDGVETDNTLPRQSAALLTLPSATPLTRGGVYLGGFTQIANNSSGGLTATLKTAILAFGANLLIELVQGPNSYRYVIYNALLSTFVLPTAVTVADFWRTQRRRRPGVGI